QIRQKGHDEVALGGIAELSRRLAEARVERNRGLLLRTRAVLLSPEFASRSSSPSVGRHCALHGREPAPSLTRWRSRGNHDDDRSAAPKTCAIRFAPVPPHGPALRRPT